MRWKIFTLNNRTLCNLAALPRVIKAIRKDLKVQQEYISYKIDPVIEDLLSSADTHLSPKEIHKIKNYYGLAVPAILAESFVLLQGRKLSETERWIATCLGAMTGLFDDFFDVAGLSKEMVKEKIFSPEISVDRPANEQLFSRFYREVLKHSSAPEEITKNLYEVYLHQVKSLEQEDGTLNEEQTWDVTQAKGGSSLLFYRSGIMPQPPVQEITFLFNVGALMQVANDIFDVYKDREAGVRTGLMFLKNIDPFRERFNKDLNNLFLQSHSLSYKRKAIKHFMERINLAVFCRALVALDQLKMLEKKTNGEFLLEKYTRKDLICDMDTKKNMLRSAAYFLNYSY
ncbi:MAG: class 1 isoprenoid biosynthesis enzyme [Ferruginibacter sp.]